jgi:hypothetical protein
MAGTTKNERITAPPGSDLRQLIIQHNALVADLETLRASVQGGTGVTPVAASALTASKIATLNGTVLSSAHY